ncbi:translation initiation factor IF-2-like [Moschus berezovskii]|uniref:translation initiation factor IF-2-like n=1 Tax=Moschus berezovskii TaxID=68408 RepID=UPI00244493F9|nr:translation initiation factor IF-2-like [Moschus berezovskii]
MSLKSQLNTKGKRGVSRESPRGREGGGGDGKKPRSSSADRPSQGCGAGAEVRPGRHPGPAAPQTPRSGLATETQGRAKQEVPPPRRRHPRRGRRPRPRPLEGGDARPEAGAAADSRGNGRPGRRPERPLGVAKIPGGERRAQSGAGTCFRERVKRAVERDAALPRLLPAQLRRGFLPACALGPALRTLFSCLRAPVVVLAPPPPAFVPDRADLESRRRCPPRPARRKRPDAATYY